MLVLDANILIRAVLGQRVRTLITTYGNAVELFAPDVAFTEACEHLPKVLVKRRTPVESGMAVLESLGQVIQAVDFETYSVSEEAARKRLLGRDPEDWPVLATALVLNCPIWTEDTDFFGSGIATWTTDRVELFLQGAGTG
ncbi:MAG: PIN domain-containing protein [Bryobacteraceae bacterium]